MGEDARICKITQVQNFRGHAHAREHSITADFPPTLIRNQQVIGSSPIAGSRNSPENTATP